MTEPIEEIIDDVKTLFDFRIEKDKAHNELATLINPKPDAIYIHLWKYNLNRYENEHYDAFLEDLETDFNRVFYIIEFEGKKPLDRSLDDAGLEKAIKRKMDFLSLRDEVESILWKILKNVRKYRRRYNNEYSGKPFCTITRTFDERLKNDKFLQQLYEGTVFNHVDSVLGKYDLTESLDYAQRTILQF